MLYTTSQMLWSTTGSCCCELFHSIYAMRENGLHCPLPDSVDGSWTSSAVQSAGLKGAAIGTQNSLNSSPPLQLSVYEYSIESDTHWLIAALCEHSISSWAQSVCMTGLISINSNRKTIGAY
uniref:Uncharacterized protein n=1 Tax=Eutreptiella gymnastica TaxID=73025 RepID=A0A7S1N5H3_9EUGL|mmetsp:Transcript_122852/g.213087  ORF Transcript_122852/g.213087 Transcript_122852/m.213087 type:complete len:122 (+) Transcript_122852:1255-1620(+)